MTCSISATTLGWMPSVGSSRISSRGLVEQRPGDGELLALTARQQAGRPAQQVGQRGERVEHLVDLGPHVRDQLQVLHRGHLREAELALRDVAEASRTRRLGAHLGDVLAVEQDLARLHRDQADRDPQQRRLAGAVVAHDGRRRRRWGSTRRRRTAPSCARSPAVTPTISSIGSAIERHLRHGSQVDLLHLAGRPGSRRPSPRRAPCRRASPSRSRRSVRMNSMSCSMTTMVRSPTIRFSSSPVSSRSSALMPATVSSRNITFASCTSSMPTSSHCFCPCARIPAGRCASAVRPIVSNACSTRSGTLPAGEQRPQRLAVHARRRCRGSAAR